MRAGARDPVAPARPARYRPCMSADPQQVETLMQARHAAEEALRTGDEELVPAAVRAAYEAGSGVDDLAEATGLSVEAVMEMLALG